MDGLSAELYKLGFARQTLPSSVGEGVVRLQSLCVRRVFNAGSQAEADYDSHTHIVIQAYRNGLITYDRALDLLRRL